MPHRCKGLGLLLATCLAACANEASVGVDPGGARDPWGSSDDLGARPRDGGVALRDTMGAESDGGGGGGGGGGWDGGAPSQDVKPRVTVDGATTGANPRERCDDGLDNDGNGTVDDGCPCLPGES